MSEIFSFELRFCFVDKSVETGREQKLNLTTFKCQEHLTITWRKTKR